MARTELPNGVILPAEYSDDWYEDMTSNLTKLDDVIGSDSEKLNADGVDFLRMSSAALTDGGTGNFSDLNSSYKIKTGDLVLDSGRKLYQVVSVDSTNERFTVGNSLFKVTAESDLAPVAESGDYDDLDNKPDLNPYDQHIADTDIHVTASDKTTWDAVTSKANDSDVVHKSGNESISGNKTFSSNVNVYNSDSNANTPNLCLRSSKIEISLQGNTSGSQDLTYLDKNNTAYAFVKGVIQSNGSAVKIRAVTKNSSDNLVINELQMLAYTNGNKAIIPSYPNEVDLGVSSYKWKSFNGVEPSSLGMPDLNNGIDISSYFTLGTSSNSYTPSVNGWICIKGVSTLGSAGIYVESPKGFYASAVQLLGINSNLRFVNLCFPVVKDEQYTIVLKTIDTSVTAKFFPCQGNV